MAISNEDSKLSKNALIGAVWTYAQQFSTIGIQFVVSIFLARLLAPSEFGLIGMLTIFIQIATVFVQSGLTQSLIRTNKIEDIDLSTIFIFNLVVSIVLYIILFFTAPYIALFYKQPILKDLLRVLSLTFVINAFSVVQITLLTKKLDFKRQTKVSIIALIIGSSTAIFLAYSGYGVWSLVSNQIIIALTSVILYWKLSNWRPKLIFSKERFKKHFKFGFNLTVSGVLNVIFTNIYIIVIGRVFQPAALGFYTRAQSLRDLPIRSISSSLNKVTYPYFAKINNDIQLKSKLRQVISVALFICSPVLMVIALLSEEIIVMLFTDKWLPSAQYLRLLCLAGLFFPINAFNLNILLVKGRSDLFLRLEVIKKVFIILNVIISIKYGIEALIIGQIILMVTLTPLNGYYLRNLIKYTYWEQFKDLIAFTAIAVLISFIMYIIKINIAHSEILSITAFLSFSTIFFLLYLLLSFWLRPDIFKLLKNLIKNIKK